MIMADQATGVRRMVVGDRSPAVGGDYIDIKIHRALTRNGARLCAHSMSRMADRARESVLLNVAGVFTEAGVIHDLVQVVALRAQGIGSATRAALGAQIRVREQIGNERTRDRRLAELIPAFQDVRENRSVRTTGSRPAEFAIVVAVVAVGTQDAGAHGAPERPAIKIQLVITKAGLRERTTAIKEHGMAGSGERTKFRDNVHRVATSNRSQG